MLPFHALRRAGLAALALLAAACGDGQSPGGTTQLSVMLKDAPGDVKAAVVTIEEVQLLGDDGKLVLTTTPTTVDLLTLANSTADLVQDFVVPSGTYHELRFVISGGYVEVENDDGSTSIYASSPTYAGLPVGAVVTGDLQMPSLAQSGLKVKLSSDALTLTGEQKVVLVDFDVSQSFGHAAGEANKWVMHPVITGGDIGATGSVHATVQLGEGVTLPGAAVLGEFSATLTDPSDGTTTNVALTDDDSDGVFEATFLYVAPGDYEITLVPPATVTSATTDPAQPVAVTVVSDQQAEAALTVTAAE